MKNVLLIGKGKRMQSVILPALWSLRDRFTVSNVFSRSGGTPSFFDPHFVGPSIKTLKEVDMDSVDLIVMAIPMKEVPGVLSQLATLSVGRCTLLLDTPVLAFKDRSAKRFFKAFREVRVSEDSIALPPYLLARRIQSERNLGKLCHAFFFHCAYRYHGLASAEMLADASLYSVRKEQLYGGVSRTHVRLGGGAEATFFEPRDYAVGKFLLTYERGALADYDVPKASRIEYDLEGGFYKGLIFEGKPCPLDPFDLKYQELLSKPLFEPSPMHGMKIRAMMDLLDSAVEKDTRFCVSAKTGMRHATAIAFSEKLGWYRKLY